MTANEYHPRDPAPDEGIYEELNIFGTPTGRVEAVSKGEPLPGAPIHFTWRPLGEYSAAELRQRAVEYRRMADTARTAEATDNLRKLAERFDALADRREHEG